MRGNPLDARVRALIAELDAFSSSLYPAESNHFDAPETMAAANVCFLVALREGEPVGCGAVKHCGEWGEIKRMYVGPSARGNGIGFKILSVLLGWARVQGLSLVRLETGPLNTGALRLYRRFGFEEIGAFPPYKPDPLSIFMELRL